MDQALYTELQRPGATLGQAAAQAKGATTDLDVRRTWIFFGDPTLPSLLAGFSAADLTAPTISSVSASSVTQTAAVITWSTDEASDSQVEYGRRRGMGALRRLIQTSVRPSGC